MNKKEWKTNRDWLVTELARLERMNWRKDKKIAGKIFPYTLIEAINLLLNSKPKENLEDLVNTGEKVDKLLDDLIESL